MERIELNCFSKKPKNAKSGRIDFNTLDKDIIELELFLIKIKIYENSCYKNWIQDFERIYSVNDLNLRLYILFAIIYFLGIENIIQNVIIKEKSDINKISVLKTIKENQDNLKILNNKFNLLNLDYFEPFFEIIDTSFQSYFESVIKFFLNLFLGLSLSEEYKFDYLYQNLIASTIRHKSGEFYTPPFLTKKMVEESYTFGDNVLDPCCGSGNFLIEVIKRIISSEKSINEKIDALNNLYGFDINPISVYISKVNLLILLKELLNDGVSINLYLKDFLFDNTSNLKKKFDLIIGNPPWYTLRDIDSIENQEKIKNLAEKLGIKPKPKNILNIEIASLFFYQAKEIYMKESSKIFFVITKGVITGSHASKFRNFDEFKNIKIWFFNKKIESLFNIDFICLYAEKDVKSKNKLDYEFPASYFTIREENIDYFSNLELILEKVDSMIPYYIEKEGENKQVYKLISKKSYEELIPIKNSYYKKLFHKGADLNPRNLIFITSESINDELNKISPDSRIFFRAKSSWNKNEFSNEIIEKKYLFKVIKSTELVKFYVYDYYLVFLPLAKNDLIFNYNELSNYAKIFYDKINKIYLKNKKETTKHNSLLDNLNRWSKLINQRQKSQIKVVYNNSGSNLNSAVIIGDFLITGDLSFYDTKNADEAYYLSAILNSNILGKQIKIKKSSRHIFKIPFEIPIEKFDSNNSNHIKLSNLGKKGSIIAKNVVDQLLKTNGITISKVKIQKTLAKNLNSILNEIDEILTYELNVKK